MQRNNDEVDDISGRVPKVWKTKGLYVLYIKKNCSVSDTCTWIGICSGKAGLVHPLLTFQLNSANIF